MEVITLAIVVVGGVGTAAAFAAKSLYEYLTKPRARNDMFDELLDNSDTASELDMEDICVN